MFEDYLQDSFVFFEKGENKSSTDQRAAKMYFRAAVFCAASSLESFVNFIGDTFRGNKSIDKNEIAYLNDKILEVVAQRGKIEERVKYYSIDSKVKFIIKRFDVPLDPLDSDQWRHFIEFKKFRDSLVHPRNLTDTIELSVYRNQIKAGLNANIDIMSAISQQLFSKPLRKNLLDLKLR